MPQWSTLIFVARAAAHASNCSLLRQVQETLRASTVQEVQERLIDDRFEYLRSDADYAFPADDALGVERMAAASSWSSAVPVFDVQASGVNTSAFCAFLTKAVPRLRTAPSVRGFVVLSLGSASHGSPWHPAISNRLQQTCTASLTDLLLEPKLRRWFVSQHHPLSTRSSTRTTPARGDPVVGDIDRDVHWVMHAKLHHVPLGLPRIFSKKGQRERSWLSLECPSRRELLYVNFKPRPYRTAILEAMEAKFGRLDNRYVGKLRLRTRDESDTRHYLSHLASHDFALSPPGSGIDCYRHYEALVCGAVPVVEYSPLAVELLQGMPAVFVRNWRALRPEDLRREHARLSALTFDFRRLTTDFWRSELRAAKRDAPFSMTSRR